MIKKLVALLFFIVIVVSGTYYILNRTKPTASLTVVDKIVETPKVAVEDMVFEYKKDTLADDCDQDSKMLCAVDFATKCTINPSFKGCKESRLPKFIFMNDESLKRPTEISFKVHKIKPLSADLVEIHTDSTCNGNWFGLCQGRVIYVVVPDGESWRVKDIYAIEDKTL